MAGFQIGSFLIQFLIVVGVAAVFRRLARWSRQPPLLGEMLLGILLGPSLLGWAWPDAYDVFFPEANRPLIEALAWIGLILFIYSVGSDLHWTAAEAKPIFYVSLGGLIVPFVLGSVLGLSAPHWFFNGPPSFEAMIMLGIVMSVSAIAVLGRILSDMGRLQTRAATLALGSATIDDIVGWSLLGIVAGGAAVGLVGDINLNLLIVALVFGAALIIDRYLTPYFYQQHGRRNPTLFVVLLVSIFLSALITHEAGLHAVLGPFAVGAVVSRHPVIRDYAKTRMDEIVQILFLPAFFVLAGLDIDLTLLDFPEGLIALAITFVVATAAKLVGAYTGARAAGLEPRLGFETGILMNVRGAIGLVIAKVGLEAGLFSSRGYTLLALMIALTTIASPVALARLGRFLSPVLPTTAAPESAETVPPRAPV